METAIDRDNQKIKKGKTKRKKNIMRKKVKEKDS